ncbi:MAG: DUF2294 family protein [Firmicutes bacterium]|nr:DUF2294 family protein [Bacillota bacterium]
MLLSATTKREIAEDAAKLIKNCIGKGPGNISVSMFKNTLTLTFFQTLTPLERQIAYKSGNERLVESIRKELIRCLSDNWEQLFKKYNLQVENIDGDIDIENDVRIIVFTLKEIK